MRYERVNLDCGSLFSIRCHRARELSRSARRDLFNATQPQIIACHVRIRLYCLHTLPATPQAPHACASRARLHDMFRHCSCCCFCLWSRVRKHSRRRARAYHYLTKHSLQEYLPYPLYQPNMSPHALRLILNTAALKNPTPLWHGAPLESMTHLSEMPRTLQLPNCEANRKCMRGARPPLPVSRDPPASSKQTRHVSPAYITGAYITLFTVNTRAIKNEVIVCRENIKLRL